MERRWDDVRAAFARYDGDTVAALMRAAWKDSPKTGNFCKVRFEAAIVEWFRAHALGYDADHPDVDFSREAMAAFLLRLFPDVEPVVAITAARIPRLVFALQRHHDESLQAGGVALGPLPCEEIKNEFEAFDV